MKDKNFRSCSWIFEFEDVTRKSAICRSATGKITCKVIVSDAPKFIRHLSKIAAFNESKNFKMSFFVIFKPLTYSKLGLTVVGF